MSLEVWELGFDEVPRPRTRIWVTRAAAKGIEGFTPRYDCGLLRKLLIRYSDSGFAHWEGKKKPIRPEGGGVYRIGHDSDIFRIWGFYEHDDRSSFIAIDTSRTKGSGSKRGKRNDALVKRIAAIKEREDELIVKMVSRDEQEYPRLAK